MVAEGLFVMGALTSYCTADDVLRLIAGYDTSALGSADDVEVRVRQLLAATRSAVDTEAGRDFLHHVDDEIRSDGSGGSTLALGQFGATPIQQIRGVVVDGVAVPADDWVCYADEGLVRLRPGGQLSGVFPVGVGNVVVRVDWGYATPPADVSLAQAKLIAAQILSEAAGVRGSVESMRLGDYSVSYDSGGEYAGVIRRWVEDARRVANSYRTLRFAVV